MIKTISLQNGEELRKGDTIVAAYSIGGSHKFTVTRRTKCYAFATMDVRRDGYEFKFPAVMSWSFQSYPKQTWNTTTYSVYRTEENTCNS